MESGVHDGDLYGIAWAMAQAGDGRLGDLILPRIAGSADPRMLQMLSRQMAMAGNPAGAVPLARAISDPILRGITLAPLAATLNDPVLMDEVEVAVAQVTATGDPESVFYAAAVRLIAGGERAVLPDLSGYGQMERLQLLAFGCAGNVAGACSWLRGDLSLVTDDREHDRLVGAMFPLRVAADVDGLVSLALMARNPDERDSWLYAIVSVFPQSQPDAARPVWRLIQEVDKGSLAFDHRRFAVWSTAFELARRGRVAEAVALAAEVKGDPVLLAEIAIAMP